MTPRQRAPTSGWSDRHGREPASAARRPKSCLQSGVSWQQSAGKCFDLVDDVDISRLPAWILSCRIRKAMGRFHGLQEGGTSQIWRRGRAACRHVSPTELDPDRGLISQLTCEAMSSCQRRWDPEVQQLRLEPPRNPPYAERLSHRLRPLSWIVEHGATRSWSPGASPR